MDALNEKWSVNEPLQKQVDIVINEIKDAFESFSDELIKQISIYKPGAMITNREIFHYYDFDGIDRTVVDFEKLIVEYNIRYCEDYENASLFYNKAFSCSYNKETNVIIIRLPVVYYENKIYLGTEIAHGSFAHELLHCFQQMRGGLQDPDFKYSVSYYSLYKPKEFYKFVDKSKKNYPFMENIKYEDIEWIIEPVYFLDKREVDANLQKLYVESLRLFRILNDGASEIPIDDESLQGVYNFIIKHSSIYSGFREIVATLYHQLEAHKENEDIRHFLCLLFEREISFDEFMTWIEKRIMYAKTKFDKVVWFVITQTKIDECLSDTERYGIYGNSGDMHTMFESYYFGFREYQRLREIQDKRVDIVKYL